MEITWLGFGSFRLKGRQVTVIAEPFDKAIGLSIAPVAGDIVTLSSREAAETSAKAVTGKPRIIDGPGEYEIAGTQIVGVRTYRDRARGAERGKNTSYAIEVDDVVVGHLGALGHLPNDDQIEALGNVDVLLVPIGGNGLLDAATAAEVVSLIEPSIVIPMMYASEGLKLPADGVDRFLKEMGVPDVAPQAKLNVTKSGLPDSLEVVLLDAKSS